MPCLSYFQGKNCTVEPLPLYRSGKKIIPPRTRPPAVVSTECWHLFAKQSVQEIASFGTRKCPCAWASVHDRQQGEIGQHGRGRRLAEWQTRDDRRRQINYRSRLKATPAEARENGAVLQSCSLVHSPRVTRSLLSDQGHGGTSLCRPVVPLTRPRSRGTIHPRGGDDWRVSPPKSDAISCGHFPAKRCQNIVEGTAQETAGNHTTIFNDPPNSLVGRGPSHVA